MQRTIFTIAYFFISVTCISQQYPFVHYTPREGLVNNRARFVFQDSKGKLYIATYGGLSVYDGTRFINYNTNNGLSVDLINDIVEMGEDSMWVLTNDNNIHCLVKGKLKNFSTADNFIPLINQLIKCSDGYYYALADEGLFRLENKRFIKITPGGAQAGMIKTSLQAAEVDKKLYILSNPDYQSVASNLLVYDLLQKKFIACDSGVNAMDLFLLSPTELWMWTAKGLLMLDKNMDKAHPITLKPVPDSFHIPKNDAPHSILRDRQNNIWMAGGQGVYRITKNGETTLFTIENGLTTNAQTSIFQDYENNMWFTNEQTGLCKLSNQQLAYYPVFKPGYAITDIFIKSSGDSVWTYDGYHRRAMLLLPRGQVKEYSYPKESIPCLGIFVSTNKEWLLCGKSILQLTTTPDSKNNSPSVYYADSTNPIGFTYGIGDRNGNLVALSNKLVVFAGNKVLSESVHYMADELAIDKDNRIWVTTRSDQLFCFEILGSGDSTKLTLLRSFPSVIKGSPRSITADQSGNIWIGTRDEGLYCLHFDGVTLRSTRRISIQNGLSENYINYLFCDKDNNIWACTHSGLDKIRIDDDHFLVENITRSSNIYLPILKIQQTRKGMFWILTAAGIITYDPTRLHAGNWKPCLSFSDAVFSDTNYIPMPPDKQLLHFQNNLVFQLSAPTYIDEKQTRFSYILEGSGNKNWSIPSTNATINFVNLPPGEYTLRAKAIFPHGLYPDTESSYSFSILPPWWQTWWFKLLNGLLLLTFLLLGLRFYINRKLQLQRVTLEKRRAIEKERTRIATDMHDDLGAGLSQIKFLSESIGMKKQQHLPFEEEISSIRVFSVEMIDKMGEIVWALNEKNDTLSDLLSYTRSYAVEYLEQNGITCRVDEPDNIPQDYVSSEFRRNIYLTVKETLHNIVKHAQATEVFIKITIADRVSIQIRDNGIGINNTTKRPAGNGLINMNTRIRELKGHFEIVNNNGTEVNILVPLDK